MPSSSNLNWEQHVMHAGHVRSLSTDQDKKDVLIRAIDSGHPMIAQQTRNGHVTIHIKDDGSVVTSGSGSKGNRGTQNFESELRRAHKSVGSDFPRKTESLKQFQRRMGKKQNG